MTMFYYWWAAGFGGLVLLVHREIEDDDPNILAAIINDPFQALATILFMAMFMGPLVFLLRRNEG